MRAKCLSICATLAIISGCCSLPPHPTMTMPEGPDLEPLPMTEAQWNALTPEQRQVISDNAREWEDFWDAVEAAFYEHNRIYSR